MRKFGCMTIEVDGQPQTIDVDKELTIVDIDSGMDTVAAHLAWWGGLHGAAEEQKISSKAEYKFWKAQTGMALFSEDAKLSEWKVKQRVESMPEYLQHKMDMAKAKRNATVLHNIVTAFETKASMLQSRGKREAAQLSATGMGTKPIKTYQTQHVDDGGMEAKKAKIRKVFKKKKQ